MGNDVYYTFEIYILYIIELYHRYDIIEEQLLIDQNWRPIDAVGIGVGGSGWWGDSHN